MACQEFRGHPRRSWQAFCWSMRGLAAAWRYEASFRLEVMLAIFALPLGLWLGNSVLEKLLLTIPILMLLSMELLNSAIEAIVDLVSPEYNELAGRAKDMGSAAVLLLLLVVILTWLAILIPPYWPWH